jgi:hypothetical protein
MEDISWEVILIQESVARQTQASQGGQDYWIV